jgi:hypothetical protein
MPPTNPSTMDPKASGPAEHVSEVSSAASAFSTDSGDEQRSLWQNVKKYRKVTYTTLALTSAILLYGYDNVVVGTVSAMPVFQYVFWPPTGASNYDNP